MPYPTHPFRIIIHLLILITFCIDPGLITASGSAHASGELQNESPRVLAINSYHAGYKWSDDIYSAIHDGLNSTSKEPVIYLEYLDSNRLIQKTTGLSFNS